MEEGDSLVLMMPTGEEINVGFGGDGQVPKGRPWIITAASDNERGFTIEPNGKLKEYGLM